MNFVKLIFLIVTCGVIYVSGIALSNNETDSTDELEQAPSLDLAVCKCKNGRCVKVSSLVEECRCSIGYGLYKKDECKACDCGIGANCTFNPGVFTKGKKCICKPGYTEKSGKCVVYDPCKDKRCKNGGKCVLNGVTRNATCVCPVGYGGDLCEKGSCVRNPCQNNGICRENGNTFKCICSAGYSGTFCEKDPCMKKPCKNNGVCRLERNGFNCTCKAPYFGNTCEQNPCTINPCRNGGACQLQGNTFKCRCTDEFIGRYCETTCKCENGRCRKDAFENLKCTCFAGYGLYRENYCRECNCGLNSANCTFETNWIPEVKRCICPRPYTDNNGICIGPCHRNPCRNNGACRVEGDSFKCACRIPYFGTTCEKDPCSENPCKNNGTCLIDRNSFKCVCKSPYYGDRCERDPCSYKPCRNGGTCKVVNNSYECACRSPYFGKTCEIDPCSDKPCKNGGTCTFQGNTFKCACTEEYIGRTCETTCQCEKGRCRKDYKGNLYCSCFPQFALYKEGVCKECDCGMRAECTFNTESAAHEKRCMCPVGYDDIKGRCVATCSSNPCKNGGTCKVINGGLECICKSPYFGTTCEKDPCSRNPCENGGSCKVDKNTFKCTCRQPYFGNTCEKDPCISSPCKNGGICKVDDKGYNCVCIPPYFGKVCEKDPCTENPCLNGGTCKRDGLSFKCQCIGDYIGNTCDRKCSCINGNCYKDTSGKWKCACTKAFGLYDEFACKACDCGKDVNCTFKRSPSSDNKQCFCPNGTQQVGDRCIEICDSNKCKHGTCIVNYYNYRCKCFSGFRGEHCDEKNKSPGGSGTLTINHCLILFTAITSFLILRVL